jgi:hypothetical protein
MKNKLLLLAVGIGILWIATSLHIPQMTIEKQSGNLTQVRSGTHVILAWNDLGMHCANRYFENLCILPPYNNQHAQVIKIGSATTLPEVITLGMQVTYEVPGNSYSVNKTNFWTYASSIFGVNLPADTGLTGNGLSGTMVLNGNSFIADGIPITPFPDNDLINEHPYQLTMIKLFDPGNNLLASTQSVIPVSNEINCVSSGCHTNEQHILNEHESVTGFNPNIKPIFCASCHKDNALGTSGTPGTPDFSEAIHLKHGSITNDCYKCHPGPITQCFRDIMNSKGLVCQNCHGSVEDVGQSISNGREAWLEEPDCGSLSCHGPSYAPEPNKLYRNSKGHGGLYCSACHGSPHAIVPTNNSNDNLQNQTLQGYAGTLNKCTVCHGVNPTNAGPHGLYASVKEHNASKGGTDQLMNAFPNPVSGSVTIPFRIGQEGLVSLAIYSHNGILVRQLFEDKLPAGFHSVNIAIIDLPGGIYYYVLSTGSGSYTKKLIISQ